MKNVKKYFLQKTGFTISWDGFIITKTLFSKWVCNLLCRFKSKPVVKLTESLYIVNK